MPRGGARLGAGRPKKAPADTTAREIGVPDDEKDSPTLEGGQTPIEYMLEVMRDRGADALRRDRMAVALAPFVHAKRGDLGKKDERKQAAKVAAGGKFAPAPPPKLIINNK